MLYWPRAVAPGGVPGVDKVGHAAVFAAVAWTGRAARFGPRPLGVALVAHAVLSELVQAWLLPGRSGDPLDVVADLLGVVVGMLLAVPRPHNEARGPR